ncbi:unnamed protein product [Protopolystoma xenopodis]|uniref:Uncharacterized protein n=1 Tax=Protopolystoma xenopodis TaxID=117903 RepID=A0A448XMU9_9PLAT|nr:unnamed protein product [Protopolystoma xenopodis]
MSQQPILSRGKPTRVNELTHASGIVFDGRDDQCESATQSTGLSGLALGLARLSRWHEAQAFVVQCYRLATEHAPDSQPAWQAWAMANYAVIGQLDVAKAQLDKWEQTLEQVGSKFCPHFRKFTRVSRRV